MAPTQVHKQVLEDAVGDPIAFGPRRQCRPEPGAARSTGSARLLETPLETGQGAELPAQDIVDKTPESGLGQAPGEIEDRQVDRGDSQPTSGDYVTRLHQGSPVQPDALISNSQTPQRGHLDEFLLGKPEAVELGGGPMGENGTSLYPKMSSKESLGSVRR